MDLQKGYYQVAVYPEDVQKTAIITPLGMLEFLSMPFGLRNTGNMFQPLMDQVLGDLPFCFLFFSRDLSSHVDHLQEVFILCRKLSPRLCFLDTFFLPLVALLVELLGPHLCLSSTI